MNRKYGSKISAGICIGLLLISIACQKPSNDNQELKPTKYLNIELAATDTVGFVLSRQAAIYDVPSFNGNKIIALDFGARVKTNGRHGDWIAVRNWGDRPQNGYIHCSELTGSDEVIEAIQLTGLLPKRILCIDSLGTAQKSLNFLGTSVNADFEEKDEQVNVQFNLAKGTAKAEYQSGTKRISKFYLEPGDAVWISANVNLDSIDSTIWKTIGAEHVIAQFKPGQLNCKTHMNTFLPMAEELSRLYEYQLQQMNTVMAFPAHPQLFTRPGQALWLYQGKWLAVADRMKGVVLVSVDPLNRALLESVLARDHETPEFIIEHAGFLVVGWQGKKNSIRAYRVHGLALKDSLQIGIDYQPRSVNTLRIGSSDRKLIIGTQNGHVLCLDIKKGTVLSDTQISKSPITKLVTSGKRVYAACGKDGIKILEMRNDYSFKQIGKITSTVQTLELIHAELLVFAKQNGGLCFSSGQQMLKNEFSTMDTLKNQRIYSIAKTVPIAEVLAYQKDQLNGKAIDEFAVAGEQGIYLLRGHDSNFAVVNTLAMQAKAISCGIDLLAVLDNQSISFISISDLLTSKYGGSPMAIYNASFQPSESGSFELYDGVIAGYFVHKKEIFSYNRQKIKDTTLRNRMTVLERDNDFRAFGWTVTRATRELVVGKGTQLSIGRGGATIFGQTFQFGNIVEIGDNALPVKIGQWPVQSVMIAAKE